MRQTTLFTGIIGFLIGAVLGTALTLLAYPFLFPPPVLNEKLDNPDEKETLLQGTFIHPNPSDPLHWGAGSVSLYRHPSGHEIFLEHDFEVGPGPDYYVYITSASDIISKEDFQQAKTVELGKLKSFSGSQVYPVPFGIAEEEMRSVVIWCKTFRMLISSANLEKSVSTRTYLKIPHEPRCSVPGPRSRREAPLRQVPLAQRGEAQGIAVAITKPINAECGPGTRNPQGQGVCGASRRHSSCIWNNQTSLLVPCAAATNATVAAVRNLEIGSRYQAP